MTTAFESFFVSCVFAFVCTELKFMLEEHYIQETKIRNTFPKHSEFLLCQILCVFVSFDQLTNLDFNNIIRLIDLALLWRRHVSLLVL